MWQPEIASVMTRKVVTARESTTFKDLVALMAEHKVSGVPVIDANDRPIGVVSEADTLTKQEYQGGTARRPLWRRRNRQAWHKSSALTAGDLMTTPAITVDEHQSVAVAARLMATKNVRRLCVVNLSGALVGVVSRRDVLGTFLRPDADIRTDVEEHVFRRGMWLFPGSMTVEVKDGVATLDGKLEHRSTVQVAGQLTLMIPGVVGVDNRTRYDTDDTVSAAL